MPFQQIKIIFWQMSNSAPTNYFKFNITTNTIPDPTSTPHVSGFTAITYILLQMRAKFSQAPVRFGRILQISPQAYNLDTYASGSLIEIPSIDLVAAVGNSGVIKFINTTDYSTLSTITIPFTSTFGSSELNASESKLFVNTNGGIVALNFKPIASGASITVQVALTSGRHCKPSSRND